MANQAPVRTTAVQFTPGLSGETCRPDTPDLHLPTLESDSMGDFRATRFAMQSMVIRCAHPSGRTELRPLLRYAPFLQRLRRKSLSAMKHGHSALPLATHLGRVATFNLKLAAIPPASHSAAHTDYPSP